MKIYEVLHDEHEYVLSLLEKLERSRPDQRKSLLDEIATALMAHTKAEERTFYAILKDVNGMEDDIGEAIEEHHIVNVLLAEMSALSEESERFEAKARVLKEMVAHHIREEEQELFPEAGRVFDDVFAEAIAGEFLATKQEILEGPGIIERGRDTLRRLVESVNVAIRT